MKYVSDQPLGQSPQVVWTGFSIPVQSSHGAAKLVDELNRLDVELVRTRQELEAVKRDLTLQIEAKNNYISLAASFITAIRESQQVLADYVSKPPVISDKRNLRRMDQTINLLLNVLDHRDLVALVNSSSLSKEHIRKGSTMTAVHPLLGVVGLPVKPTWNSTFVSYWHTHLFYVPGDGWIFARMVPATPGETRCHWVDSDTDACISQVWFENNIVAGTLEERPKPKVETSNLNDWEDATHQITFDGGKHWTNVELDGDCFTACSDGKRSWSVDCIPLNNVARRPHESAVEVGTAIHEEHLVRISRKQRAALEQTIDFLGTAHPKPDKLVKRLSKLIR